MCILDQFPWGFWFRENLETTSRSKQEFYRTEERGMGSVKAALKKFLLDK